MQKGGDALLAGGIGASGGDVYINPGLPLLPGGLSGQIFINSLQWPEFDGLPGYVLSTDGDGVLTFQPVSGAIGSTVSAIIETLSTSIDQNTVYITELSSDISYISGVVSGNSADILSLSSTLIDKCTDIETLSADVQTLSTAIDNNTTNINTNTTNIALLSSDVINISDILVDKCNDIDVLSADLIELSAQVIAGQNNITTKETGIIIPSTESRFFGYEDVASYNTAKWLITAVNSVSSTISTFEVLGTQIGSSPSHSRSNIVRNDLSLVTDVIISGSSFGVNITNNESEDVTVEYIRIT
jgi:hypothetical protein